MKEQRRFNKLNVIGTRPRFSQAASERVCYRNPSDACDSTFERDTAHPHQAIQHINLHLIFPVLGAEAEISGSPDASRVWNHGPHLHDPTRIWVL